MFLQCFRRVAEPEIAFDPLDPQVLNPAVFDGLLDEVDGVFGQLALEQVGETASV